MARLSYTIALAKTNNKRIVIIKYAIIYIYKKNTKLLFQNILLEHPPPIICQDTFNRFTIWNSINRISQ